MSDIEQKILAQANMTRMLSLPELLLCELNVLQGSATSHLKDESGDVSLEKLLSGDMFLYARLLSSTSLNDERPYFSPQQLIQGMGRDGLKAMVRQAATQMSFGQTSPSRVRFLKQLYLQSVLTRTLSEQLALHVLPESNDKNYLIQQAAFCGLFLNIGALVLEQVYSKSYLEILAKSENTAELLNAERNEYGIDHAELGAQLLLSWGVERLCCDALQYHHLDISQILDATPMVKIAWLANQLADEAAHLEAPLWADALFDLKDVSLMETWESAQAALNHASQTLKVSYSTTRYLPLPTSDDVDVLNQEKTALKQLRKNAEADNLLALAREGLSNAGSQDELGQAMGSAARLLFGHGESLLFIYSEDADSLSCLTGTPSRNELNQIVIRCEPDRSVIADCFLGNSAILQSPSEQQAVIDKQILSLLGTDNFCCESLVNSHTDGPCGVLVLGIPLQQIDNYKKQTSLRYEFCLELGKKLAGKQEFLTAEGDVIAGYERRIRETIHEANNPLGIIKNYLQLLSIKQGEDTKIQSEISFMKSEIDRVSGILEKLKEKPEEPEEIEQSVSVNINSVVTSLLNMFSGSFAASESINIETSLDSDLPELTCNENAIRQIITNLVKNSAEAFEDGGTLLVKTAGNFYMNGNRYIQLIVKDNGPGIAASILDKLFASGDNVKSDAGISSSKINSSNISTSNISTPNISTKGGSHMGSGLSIVKNLVAELGGQISCQTTPAISTVESGNKSRKNSGTEITVLLPVSVSKQNTSLNTLTKNNNSADLS